MNAWAITFEHDDLYECFTDSAENSWAEWLEGRLQSKEYFEAKGYRCVEVKVTEKPEQRLAIAVAALRKIEINDDCYESAPIAKEALAQIEGGKNGG